MSAAPGLVDERKRAYMARGRSSAETKRTRCMQRIQENTTHLGLEAVEPHEIPFRGWYRWTSCYVRVTRGAMTGSLWALLSDICDIDGTRWTMFYPGRVFVGPRGQIMDLGAVLDSVFKEVSVFAPAVVGEHGRRFQHPSVPVGRLCMFAWCPASMPLYGKLVQGTTDVTNHRWEANDYEASLRLHLRHAVIRTCIMLRDMEVLGAPPDFPVPRKKILGCHWTVFKEHMEARMRPGMTWANWGTVTSDLEEDCACNDPYDEDQRPCKKARTERMPIWGVVLRPDTRRCRNHADMAKAISYMCAQPVLHTMRGKGHKGQNCVYET